MLSDGVDKVRIGMIGCGRFSEQGHLPFYFIHPEAELAAVCDLREEFAAKAGAKYRIPRVFTEYERMLDESALDAVVVCTPTFTHSDIAAAAASRGLHVFCEKPMAPSVAEGERMTAACRDAGVVLHVGYHKRYDRGMIKLKELLDSEEYGRCFQAEIEWRGLSTFGNVPFVNRILEIADKLGVSTESFSPGWRFHDTRCPGGVFEVICHQIDLALWFFGPPDKVEGEIRTLSPDCNRADHAVILLKNERSATTYITMSHQALSLHEEDKGLFRCTGGNLSYLTTSPRQALLPAKLSVETGEGLFGRTRNLPVLPDLSPRTAPHFRKIDNFIKAVKGELPDEDSKIVCRGEDALEVDRVVANFT